MMHIGLSLAGVSGICGLDLPILKGLLFGSLISAVDPVAVSIYIIRYIIKMRTISS